MLYFLAVLPLAAAALAIFGLVYIATQSARRLGQRRIALDDPSREMSVAVRTAGRGARV
jgi:hypothetical protein